MLNVALARQRREELGLTQDQIGKQVGVDQGVISRWESGDREPRTIESLQAWARALKVDPGALLREPAEEAATS